MQALPTIVIPYYKLRYLDAALDSLAKQTKQGFKVFIGDDASPENPEAVLRKYENRLSIQYYRFEENLGRYSLVQHWNRCVRRTESDWVWLFSDDDVASPECMEAFEKVCQEDRGPFDIGRFNTHTIDGAGAVIRRHPAHPEMESGADFALAKIAGERFSFAVEYVFRRSVFEAAGGFVDFPLAWSSDDASWIRFARNGGFRAIEPGVVFWRRSDLNISSPKPEHVSQKWTAYRQYLTWLKQEIPNPAFQEKVRLAVRKHVPSHLQPWGGTPGLAAGLRFWCFFTLFTRHMDIGFLRALLGLGKYARGGRLAIRALAGGRSPL